MQHEDLTAPSATVITTLNDYLTLVMIVTFDQKGNVFILLLDGMTLFALIHTTELGSMLAY